MPLCDHIGYGKLLRIYYRVLPRKVTKNRKIPSPFLAMRGVELSCIIRRDAAVVAEDVRRAAELQKELEREARQKLREDKKNERKDRCEFAVQQIHLH